MKRLYLIYLIIIIVLLFVDYQAQSLAGAGTAADPYQIYDAADMDDVRNYSFTAKLHFKLMNDIDLISYPNWTPIGTGKVTPWRNYFDGSGNTIKNLTLTTASITANGNIGLFGSVGGNVTPDSIGIKNLILDSATVNVTSVVLGDFYYGILTGYLGFIQAHSTVDSVFINNPVVNISHGNTTSFRFGCITGELDNRVSRVIVNNADITIAVGNITDATDGSRGIGGVVGGLDAGYLDQAKFEGRIEVTSSQSSDGALLGNSGQTVLRVTNSYSRGKALSLGSRPVGGIVGHFTGAGGIIEDCYAAMDSVYSTTPGRAGQLIGFFAGAGTINTSYADIMIGEPPLSVGTLAGTDTTGTQLTTTEMGTQGSYTGWDFTTIWKMGEDGYPQFQWETTPNEITILTPVNGFPASSPITVTWTGIGNYDSVTVNGDTVLADTTYSLVTDSTGLFPIVVRQLDDTTAFDRVVVTVYPDASITIDTAYTQNNIVSIKAISVNIDSMLMYAGIDTLTMIPLGQVDPGVGLVDSTYQFPLTKSIYDNAGTWYKAIEDRDTSNTFDPVTLHYAGVRGGQWCYYPTTFAPIEIRGVEDLSCGWVGQITRTYIENGLKIPKSGPPNVYVTGRLCTYECASDPDCNGIVCRHYPLEFTVIDTVANDTTKVEFIFVDEYNVSGVVDGLPSVTVNSRRYHLSGIHNPYYLYMDDLRNNVLNIKLLDLRGYTNMKSVSLWVFDYVAELDMIVKYKDGDQFADVLPRRDTTLIVIHDAADFQRTWSFNALPAPGGPVAYDVFFNVAPASWSRNYFRGIRPKAVRNGKAGI